MWDKLKEWLGLGEHDEYIKDYIEDTNMRSIKYMCSFVIFVEAWMILRTMKIIFFGGEDRTFEWIVVHMRLYLILMTASVIMLWYSMTYKKNGIRRSHELTIVWKLVYTGICMGFGIYVSYLDYVKGEQVMSFLTMILFGACLLVWRPFISLTILTVDFAIFYYLCDRAVPATIATRVNMFTTWVAMMMIALSNYRQRMTEARKDMGLEDISNHDDLTHVSNMHHFRKAAVERLKEAGAMDRLLTFIYFDIVNFKTYNERYGFEGGNVFLKKMAGDIEECFKGAEIARLSDDRFIVLADVDRPEKKVELLQEKILAYQGDVYLRLKAGIYVTNGMKADGVGIEDINILCDRARFAVKSIKDKTEALYCFYDEKLDDVVRRKHYIVSHIDEAVKKGWIRIFYQPIIDSADGRVCACEALARWDDPELGMLSPGEFIDTLEEFRQIHKLDICIVEQVCRDYVDARERGHTLLPVSINLSRLDFELCDIANVITDIETRYSVPKEQLEIEITESALSRNAAALNAAMDNLRVSRHNLWLDDFGAGYSSFNVLKDYSFDVLKIDMKFLDDFGRNERFEPIIGSIISLCRELKMISLAEGVETKEQYEFLKSIGCNRMQGYLFSKPLPREELRGLFEKGVLSA